MIDLGVVYVLVLGASIGAPSSKFLRLASELPSVLASQEMHVIILWNVNIFQDKFHPPKNTNAFLFSEM